MSTMYFRDIDNTNEEIVRAIKLKPGQEKFIETVEECLQEAKLHHEWHPVAIYYHDEVVGFAMYGSFGAHKDTWIDRIMIDENYQGKGLGRKAMEQLIARVSREYEVNTLYLSILEENRVAQRLYESLGFEYIDEKDPNGELIFRYTVV